MKIYLVIHSIPKEGDILGNNTQILKGILEGCVLSIISEEKTYGYELLIKLKNSGFDDMVEGTLYPLLLRLEKNGLILSEKEKSESGMTRKYFYLTEEGKKELNDFIKYWNKLHVDVNNLLRSDKNGTL